MAKAKPLKQRNTGPKQMGLGDYYGSGVKQPGGKIRDVFGSGKINMSKPGKPPKALA